MKHPNWNEFLGKYPDNPQDAFEALCRLLFRAKYGIFFRLFPASLGILG